MKWLILMGLVGFLFACSTDEPNSMASDDVATDDGVSDEDVAEFQGTLKWLHTFGGSDIDEAVDVVVTLDGAFMILATTHSSDGDISGRVGNDADYWLLKLNDIGELLWERSYGGSEDDRATSINATSDGGFVISGYSRSNDGDVTSNEGFYDYWIVKIDAGGTIIWEQNFGFSGNDQAFKVFETQDGGFFATGFLDVSASAGAGNDFQTSSPSASKATLHGVGEFWAVRMDAEGNKLWRRYFGGTDNDRSYDALQTQDGGFLLVGASESDDFDIIDSKGSYDLWVVRLEPNGDLLWTRSFGGSQIDIGFAVIEDGNGDYLIVGDSRSADQDISNPKGNADAWVVKFDDQGNKIWERSYGGPEFDSARDIIRLNNGDLALTGNSRSASGDLSNNNGQNDAWIFVVTNDGTLRKQVSVGGSSLDLATALAETDQQEIIIVGNTESNDGDINEQKGQKDLLIALFN
ncbi:MAG: hypothetical protein HKM28_07545 [Flavobacteriaceae bacterium]|nr:hypothetical protein [Flavobacteriaceae bacterium]